MPPRFESRVPRDEGRRRHECVRLKVFFGGAPGRVLDLWKSGEVELLVTEDVFAEYVDVLRRLTARYPNVDPDPIVGLVAEKGLFVQPAVLPESVSVDPDDDKFIAAAIGGRGKVIVSGDKHLLDVSGHRGVRVLKPADFASEVGSQR